MPSFFMVVMYFTSGPNIMLLSSGLTYGFRRTISHIVGIAIGFAFMVAAVVLGLGSVFLAYPVLQTVLKYAGAACLLYLVGTASTLVWTLFGTALRPVLTSERLVRAFNVLKPILLPASLDPVLMDA